MKNAAFRYETVQTARQMIDTLPSGPCWTDVELKYQGFQTSEPILMYRRDSIQCTEFILHNPLFRDNIQFAPVRHWDQNGKQVFTEPISGRQAWETQVISLWTFIITNTNVHSVEKPPRWCYTDRDHTRFGCYTSHIWHWRPLRSSAHDVY